MGPRRCGAEGRCTGRKVVSNPRPLHEAKDVPDAAQKDDGVTGRVRSIPLQFMVRDFDFRSDGDVRPLQRRARAAEISAMLKRAASQPLRLTTTTFRSSDRSSMALPRTLIGARAVSSASIEASG